jgi:hypothetical protein
MATTTYYCGQTWANSPLGLHSGTPPDSTSSDAIVITGDRNSSEPPTSYLSFNLMDNGLSFDDGHVVDRPPTDPTPTYNTFSDAKAALHTLIDGKADLDSKEHYGIIYKGPDGKYHTSPVFEGTAQKSYLSELFGWMISNAVQFSQVIDLYHNHDRDQYGNTTAEALANRYPSDSDWRSAADFFVHPGQGIAGADPSIFTLTVEDTTHVSRDFVYSQEAHYETLLKDEDLYRMVDGVDLPPPSD